MKSVVRNATLAVAALAMGGCDTGSSEPLERIGRPLRIAAPTADGGDARVASTGDGAAPGTTLRASGPEAGGGAAAAALDAGPATPQPARALTIAAEADETGAAGNLTAAAAAYGRAVQHDPRSPWLRVAHAWYLSRLGHVPQARDELERALDMADRPDPLLRAAIHHGAGEIRESQRDRERARESYRAGLRAWSGRPLAQALLRLTPVDDVQRRAAERLAFGSAPPQGVLKAYTGLGRPWAEPLAATKLASGELAVVFATPPPDSPPLPVSARYFLRLGPVGPRPAPDAGPTPEAAKVSLGEAPVVRWHQADVSPFTLGPERQGLIVTTKRTGPGAGAPAKTHTALVDVSTGSPELLISRLTGASRDAPLGCRRGWHETVTPNDNDGDGTIDGMRVTRRDFVRPRLATGGSSCTERESLRPAQSLPFRDGGDPSMGTPDAAPAGPVPDGGPVTQAARPAARTQAAAPAPDAGAAR